MTIQYIATFIIGTLFGSFSSVIIDRYTNYINNSQNTKPLKSILVGRSECPYCKQQLKAKNLIPIISFILQRGKCSNSKCQEPISKIYPFLELITGLLFIIALFLSTNNNTINLTQFTLTALIFFLGINIAIIDLKTKYIPNSLSILLAISSITYTILLRDFTLQSIFISASIGYFFFYLQHFISKGKWVGLGDADLGLSIGLLFAPLQTIFTILQSYILGTLILIPILLLKKDQYGLKSQIPFGPFLVCSLILSLSFGEKLINWYLNSFIYLN